MVLTKEIHISEQKPIYKVGWHWEKKKTFEYTKENQEPAVKVTHTSYLCILQIQISLCFLTTDLPLLMIHLVTVS